MAGIEGGFSPGQVAVATGVNAAPGVGVATAPSMGEMAIAGLPFASVGDIAPATHGELAKNITSLTDLVSYDPTMDSSMMGVEGRATPFDTAALHSVPTGDILAQATDIAAKAWESSVSPISEQTPVVASVYDVVSEAEKVAQAAWEKPSFGILSPAEDVARAAEITFAKDQMQQIALYGIPVATQELVAKEITEPVVQSVTEIVAVPQIARAEQVVEAIAREVVTDTLTPEEIGRKEDAALAGKVELLASSLGLEQLAREMADVKASAVVQQEKITAEPQATKEVTVEGEVLEETATEAAVQPISVVATLVAKKGEHGSVQLLPDEDELDTDKQEDERKTPQQVRQSRSRRPQMMSMVKPAPIRAEKENRQREIIAGEVVEEVKEEIEAKSGVGSPLPGDRIAERFAQRANAEAKSPVKRDGLPDGSVADAVKALEGKEFNDPASPVDVLRRDIRLYTAVDLGHPQNASYDDLARVFQGSRRGMIVAD